MKFFLRKELYFEIDVENGSDRAVVTRAFDEVVEPAFRDLIQKIRFSKTEIDSIRKLTGQDINVRALSKRDFLQMTNQKKESFD